MIRTFITGLIVVNLFVSCHKSPVQQPVEKTINTNFKDEHIAVAGVKLTQTGSGEVKIDFSTRYEKNISLIEIYGGNSTKTLCSIFNQEVTGESHALKLYSVLDKTAGPGINFYMIKYTTTSGNWSFSELYKIEMK